MPLSEPLPTEVPRVQDPSAELHPAGGWSSAETSLCPDHHLVWMEEAEVDKIGKLVGGTVHRQNRDPPSSTKNELRKNPLVQQKVRTPPDPPHPE